MFRQLKLTCRGMFHCTSQTIGQSLQRSLIMAQEQKSTRRKEQKAPKNTSCPRAARPASLPQGKEITMVQPLGRTHRWPSLQLDVIFRSW